MLFGWRVVKHVKSNAIVYAGPDRTLGDRRRPDVARRCVADRDLESAGSRAFAQRQRSRQRRFFPISGWIHCRR